MFCTNCGKQIPDDARFCPECGAQTEPQANTASTANQANTYSQQNQAYSQKGCFHTVGFRWKTSIGRAVSVFFFHSNPSGPMGLLSD